MGCLFKKEKKYCIQLGNYAIYLNKFISGGKMRTNVSKYSRRDIIERISLFAIDIQENRAQIR